MTFTNIQTSVLMSRHIIRLILWQTQKAGSSHHRVSHHRFSHHRASSPGAEGDELHSDGWYSQLYKNKKFLPFNSCKRAHDIRGNPLPNYVAGSLLVTRTPLDLHVASFQWINSRDIQSWGNIPTNMSNPLEWAITLRATSRSCVAAGLPYFLYR
jgi:hypothetical protein